MKQRRRLVGEKLTSARKMREKVRELIAGIDNLFEEQSCTTGGMVFLHLSRARDCLGLAQREIAKLDDSMALVVGEEAIHVKITEHFGPMAWYAYLIGQTLEVYVDSRGYVLKEDYDQGHAVPWRHIDADDCIKMEVNTNEQA